jgi:hypothetical protein
VISAAIGSGTLGSSPARLRTASTSRFASARWSCPTIDPFALNPNACSHAPSRGATVLKHCAYHCRGCDSCFTSLAAFDAHRSGPFDDRLCDLPGADLEEHRGVCRISDADEVTGQPIPRVGTIYAVSASQAELERLRGLASERAQRRERRPPKRLRALPGRLD